jgi:hypothetical protein
MPELAQENGRRSREALVVSVSPELRYWLKEDIRRRGILVPILIAQDGECLDGRVRLEIGSPGVYGTLA